MASSRSGGVSEMSPLPGKSDVPIGPPSSSLRAYAVVAEPVAFK
jgi:hypothetical protein